MVSLNREYAPGSILYALSYAPDKVELLLVSARENRYLWIERSANTEFFSYAIHVEQEQAFTRFFTEVTTDHIRYKTLQSIPMAIIPEQYIEKFMQWITTLG